MSHPSAKGKRSVFSPHILSIEIICRIYTNTAQGILPLKKAGCEAAAQRRPAETRRKNSVFPAKRQPAWFWNATRFKRKMPS